MLAVGPALAFSVMHFTPIAQNGFVDPYVYTGYINNFEDLFHRYGVTYYGVRFGLIAPAQLTAALFGPVGGYIALRYAYAFIAGASCYFLVKQRFGQAVASAIFLLLLTSPYFARALLWDHPEASGVPFLFAAVCLFLVENRNRRMFDVCAGFCAGLAIHSNIFVAAPLGIFVASYVALWLFRQRGLTTIVQRLLAFAAGIVAITLVAIAYYWSRVGLIDIFSVTIQTSLGLVNGGMANWRTPGVGWVVRQWSVLTPVFLSTIVLFAWSRRRVTFLDEVIVASAVATTAFFYIVQFLLNGNSLELFYYFAYLLPFVFLLLAQIIGVLWSNVDVRARIIASVLLLSVAIGPWILYSFGIWYPTSVARHLAVVGTAMTTVLLWRHVPRYRPVTSLAATTALGLTMFSSFSVPIYAGMISNRLQAGREMDVYGVAQQLIDFVPRAAIKPGAVGFWYSNEPPGNSMQSVQSTYLWGFSKVQGQGRGLPHLEAGDIGRLRQMQLKWLVLLAEKEGDLALGRETLSRIGIEHKPIDSRILRSGAYVVHFELLQLR